VPFSLCSAKDLNKLTGCLYGSLLLPLFLPLDEICFYFMYKSTDQEVKPGINNNGSNDSPKIPVLIPGTFKGGEKDEKDPGSDQCKTQKHLGNELLPVVVGHRWVDLAVMVKNNKKIILC
jgi:hypothetical protein